MTATATRSPWRGRLRVRYGCDPNSNLGRTYPIEPFCQAPLKLQRPFYPVGKRTCCSTLLHTAGGIVGGDRLEYNLNLDPDARALLTTAAAGKVYGSNGPTAEQIVEISLAAGSQLAWLPQETIIFDGAWFTQQLRVELAPGARWVGWEVTRLGRSARGEKFLRGCWRSRLEVWQQGMPLWIDRQLLAGSPELWASPIALAERPVVGTFLWLGHPVTEATFSRCQEVAAPSVGGITRALGDGLVARYRGDATAAAQAWFLALWQILDAEAIALQSYLQRLGLPAAAACQQHDPRAEL